MSGDAFSASIDTSGLNAYLDDLGDEAAEAIRPAAQAGIQVLYDAVKANVAPLRRTGNLDHAIYQAFMPERSLDGVSARYRVSWNARTAPYGHLVEYGYLQRYVYRPDGMGPMVRPGMEGKPKPKAGSRASNRAALDAYYVTLPTPIQVPAKAFMRRAAALFPQAYDAAEQYFLNRLAAKL